MMTGIQVVAFLVSCQHNLLICHDLYTENIHFASVDHCRSELSHLIEEADTPQSVVMGKCRYLLVEPDRHPPRETGRYW